MSRFSALAYVDLETTGTRPAADRITEVAIVRVEHGETVERWSSLVDPEVPIPGQIQQLTGITDSMVAGAPTLKQLLPEIAGLLQGAALVAHNARFDAGFLRHAFRRAGLDFDLPVLCTLRLSRALYPQQRRHNLDALMQRHGLICEARHRAMGDCAVLPRLVQSMVDEHGQAAVDAAFAAQLQRENLPDHLDRELLDRLPRGPGVYLFYGEKRAPLYVGKSVDIRSRVMAHFSDAKRSDKELRLSQAVREVEWISTGGELGALLREAELVKRLSPIFNRRLRRHKSLFSWHWRMGAGQAPQLLDLAVGQSQQLPDVSEQFGLYRNKKAADTQLRAIAAEHGLCLKCLGFESGRGPCFAYQLKRCRGACVGEETPLQHDLRLAQALLPVRVERWPYPHPVGVVEHNPVAGITHIWVLDQWRVLDCLDAQGESLGNAQLPPGLDLDIYKILVRHLQSGKARILPLDHQGRLPASAQMAWV